MLASRLVDMSDAVALRKESVDRNTEKWPYSDFHNLSLSARRAWIEMVIDFPLDKFDAVALRKESVDRNMRWVAARINTIASLSARRAWIEIFVGVA